MLTLFRKSHKHFLLTDAGKALLYYSEKLLALESESRRVIQEFNSEERGQLKLGASHVLASYMLPRILGSFKQSYPDVNLSLSINPAPNILTSISKHEIDIGFVMLSVLEQKKYQALSFTAIQRARFVIVCRPDHPFASKEQLTFRDLIEQPILLHQNASTTRQLVEAWRCKHKLEFKYSTELGGIEAIKEGVLEGLGYTILVDTAVQREAIKRDLTTLSLPYAPEDYYMYYVTQKERMMTPILQRFTEVFSKYYRK